ncbi:S-layer homology domain-containing protein [Desulfallas thermosapovorans]|uniref:S-layer family protein n=1 Tax=Desulfallas thermosapovorans DSM 6562 TaxID=1121431 RepID=A0A5S4ZN45_9FIRM|nr:S-layer homology domain-containing protein [Desulfallas thermosapovorans]TYO93262.1 S-layer family protein [Desulfallas thermosapovorans DSM 6562]
MGFQRRCRLSAIVAIIFLLSITIGGAQAALAKVSDFHEHWAAEQIADWMDKGLAGGYPDGTFKPNNQITRAEFVALVNRATGKSNPLAEANFKDVNKSHWFYGEVAVATGAGYVGGYSDGTFKPDNPISRQEVASIMSRLLQLGDNATQVSFQDAQGIAAWATDAVNAVVSAGIMGGYTDGTFKAASPITRAEAVVTLDRAVNISIPAATTVTYDNAGTYGPAAGTETIKSDVVIGVSDVTLQNVIITGDLLLAKGIGNGDVILKNVTVKGETTVNGGGANSITLEDCTIPNITVDKDGVRVVAVGKTTVKAVTLKSGATLVEVTVTGDGFNTVTLSEVVPADAKINLSGDFVTVNVQAKDAKIEIAEGMVRDLILDARAVVTGKGDIETAHINVAGSTIMQTPTNTMAAKGVTATVGDKTVGTVTSSGGSSGGSGGGSDTINVNAITVTGAGNATTITTDGGTLQMNAAVSPANASNKSVSWSVANGTGMATISATGLLTALTNGTVTVTATAKDGSGVKGQLVVTISGQEAAFTPGAGGSLPEFTPFTAEAGKIGGLYIAKNHKYYSIIFSGKPIYHHEIELYFVQPDKIGATGYKLQYSKDSGETWDNYQTLDSDTGVDADLVTVREDQDNFIVSDPEGNYSYRLKVIGGTKDGYVSNAVVADIPPVSSQFTGWSLSESMDISGVMSPFVGSGLEASFTAKVANYGGEEPEYTDEHITYQWYRVNPLTYAMTPIVGATELTYITTEADLGYKLLIRATGDGENVGGYAQIFSQMIAVMPNDAYITNVSESGFILNLHKSVNGLGANELILTDNKGDYVPITSVSQGANAAIYNIAADLDPANGPFYLNNNSGFWKITSRVPWGHGRHEGVQVQYSDVFTALEIIAPSEEEFWVCVYDTYKDEPILDLTKEDFTLKDASGQDVDFKFNDPELRDLDIPPHEYLISPAEGVFSGTYTLTFTKSGYRSVSEDITLGVEEPQITEITYPEDTYLAGREHTIPVTVKTSGIASGTEVTVALTGESINEIIAGPVSGTIEDNVATVEITVPKELASAGVYYLRAEAAGTTNYVTFYLNETKLNMNAKYNVETTAFKEFTMDVEIWGAVMDADKDHNVRFYGVIPDLSSDDIEKDELSGHIITEADQSTDVSTDMIEIITGEEKGNVGAGGNDLVLGWGDNKGIKLGDLIKDGHKVTAGFDATINKPGDYTIKFVSYDLDSKKQINDVGDKATITVQKPAVSEYTFLFYPIGPLEFEIRDLPGSSGGSVIDGVYGVDTDGLTPIGVNLKADPVENLGYDSVKILVPEIKQTAGSGGKLELWYYSEDDQKWIDIAVHGWGGENGFPLAADYEKTMDVYVFADTAGRYEIAFELIDLNNNDAVITERVMYIRVD